jgi:hypothetical protein
MYLQGLLMGLLELALLAGAALYAGLVLTSYRTEGRNLVPHVDRRDLTHSAERLAVWPGVMALALVVQVATPIFGMLSEASAEVGEWFLSQRHRESQ